MSDALIIMITGACIASSCALLGCFLILRKQALMADAIAHAVLPGIVIAFLWSGTFGFGPMLIGASILGLLTTFLIEYIGKKWRLQEDATMGFVFTTLFAIGVILISLYARDVHIDTDCILQGEIAFLPLTQGIELLGMHVPNGMMVAILALVIVGALLVYGYRALFFTSFDPAFAAAIGVQVAVWHYVLMSAVSMVTILSFESVGAILVLAFLVVPPAAAYLLTQSLRKMLLLSVLFGCISAVGGYGLAYWLDASIAGAMSVVAGAIFVLCFVYGLSAKKGNKQNKPKLV